MWTLTPEKVEAELSTNNAFIKSLKSGISIVLLEDVPKELIPYMEKSK